MNDARRPIGVLGGVGPVASAEFVRTIYAYCTGESEQEFPAVLLHSDPGIAIRSTLRTGPNPESVAQLLRGLEALREQDCAAIVICCMTLHHVLPEVAEPVRSSVVSVLDVLVDAVASATPEPRLMLCSADSRRLRLFERHPRWPEVEPFVVWPSDADLVLLLRAIHDIKENRGYANALRWIDSRLGEYGADGVIAGCSEIHALLRIAAPHLAPHAVDPFDIIARAIAEHRLG